MCIINAQPLTYSFKSIARVAGKNAVGAILTGMGGDGADGMLEMKQAGAKPSPKMRKSCVVFGMPKEAIARGGVDSVMSLELIAQGIMSKL